MDLQDFHNKFARFKELREKKKEKNIAPTELEEYTQLMDELEHFLLDNPLIGQQRRKHLRADMNLDAELISGRTREFCKCLTIGSGGMFLQTKTKLSPGRKVNVRLRLPNDELLMTECEVLYISGAEGIGLKFSTVEESKFNELREILIEYYGTIVSR